MNQSIIDLGIKEAQKSNQIYKIGAVVFKGSRIYSSGYNSIRSNRINDKYKVWKGSLHAEQAAVLGLDWNKLKNKSILVIRVTRSNGLAMAFPCPMCLNMLKYIGFKDIYFSNRKGELEYYKLKK